MRSEHARIRFAARGGLYRVKLMNGHQKDFTLGGLFSAMVLLCFTSCVPQFEYIFYNHSGRDLMLATHSESYSVRSNDVVLAGYLGRKVKISDGQVQWEYDIGQMPMVPRDYWGWGFSASKIRCQIESSGVVYLLLPGESMPAHIDPLHPPALFVDPISPRAG